MKLLYRYIKRVLLPSKESLPVSEDMVLHYDLLKRGTGVTLNVEDSEYINGFNLCSLWSTKSESLSRTLSWVRTREFVTGCDLQRPPYVYTEIVRNLWSNSQRQSKRTQIRGGDVTQVVGVVTILGKRLLIQPPVGEVDTMSSRYTGERPTTILCLRILREVVSLRHLPLSVTQGSGRVGGSSGRHTLHPLPELSINWAHGPFRRAFTMWIPRTPSTNTQ